MIVSTPAPPTYISYVLNGVACPASNACFSAGTTNTYNPDSGRLTRDAHIERWDGTRWSTAKTALDSSPPLYAIECDTPNRCIAAGASSSTPVIAHWNGSAWSAAPVPVAFGPG